MSGQVQRTKRLIITSNSGWNIHNFRMNVIHLLVKHSYEIYVLCPSDEYVKEFSQIEGINYLPLKKLKRKNQNPFKELALFVELFNHYRKIKADLILHYTIKPNIYGAFACALLAIPSIAIVTGLGYSYIHGGMTRIFSNILYHLSFKFHDQILFENEDDLKIFQQKKIIKQNKGLAIKGSGVDTEYFRPLTKSKEGSFVFSYIGRMIEDKGVREFISAARILKKDYPDVAFHLIGEPDTGYPATLHIDELMQWNKEEGIIYQGQKQDIRKFIAESDCVVLPSYREGIPRILLESMSMEKVVITTDSPGCREVVEPGQNGFLVAIREIDPLVNAMKSILLMDEGKRKEMGKKGRQKAINEFESKLIAQEIFGVIENTIK